MVIYIESWGSQTASWKVVTGKARLGEGCTRVRWRVLWDACRLLVAPCSNQLEILLLLQVCDFCFASSSTLLTVVLLFYFFLTLNFMIMNL